MSDQGLIDALRDRIADLGDPGAVVIGYAIVVEVVTPGEDGPWLKTLEDSNSTPWAQMGRVARDAPSPGNRLGGCPGPETCCGR